MKILKNRKHFLVIYMLGFLFGILFINLAAGKTVYTAGIFDTYFLKNFSEVTFRIEEYLFYLLQIRILPFAVLFMFSFTIFKKLFAVLCVGWFGFSGGLLSSLSIMYLGIKGVFLCLISMFPHFLLYIPAYFVLLWYMYTASYSRWTMNKSIFVVLTLFMGLVTELYVNPILMKLFIKTI